MKVNIVCVGKIKEKYYVDAIGEYLKRLTRFADVTVTECREVTTKKPPSSGEIAAILKEESEDILKNLKGYKIALDIGGTEVSSVELADVIKYSKDTVGAVTMVIGGSYGLSDEVKNKCDRRISFGRVTYPHQLMRVILLEQTYRAFTILSGSEYHK